MHSIRTQITVITIAAILTSILAVFAASFISIKGETDRNSAQMLYLIEQDTQKNLEKYFDSIEQSVEVAANLAIESLDSVLLVESGLVTADAEAFSQTEEQIAALDEYLKSYCKYVQNFFAGVADYTQGVTAYYYSIDPGVSTDERGFFYQKIGKTGFIEQTPLDVKRLLPVDVLHDTWYDAAVKKGRPVWLGPYPSSLKQGEWICSYFVPVYKSGMLIGIMGMDIPCSTLIDLLRDIRVYETGFVCLMNAEGQVIYHPDLPIGSNLDQLGLSVDADILKNLSSGDTLIRYSPADGQERQLSFSTLTNGMKLGAIAPTAEINAPWTRLVRVILLIAVAVIILFALLIFIVMHALTYPLKELTDASKQLANANYDVDLNYQGNNEIGTLTRAFTKMRDEMKGYISDLNHQIYHDRLTDLPNMRHFFTLAEETRSRMLLEGKQPVMLYFNIVGIRYYNRQKGFDKGDQLLRDFAEILVRQFDNHRVCRLNSDRFGAVTDEGSADEELRAILKEWERSPERKRIPICIGAYPNRLDEVDVNVACDRAKFAGDRNKSEHSSSITYFNEEMLKNGEIYLHIIQNLDQALKEGWVKVYYQPIVRAADGKVCDEEALARWIDPVFGFLSPGDFIPALEESKMIYKLDLYVLEQVLMKMKKTAEAGLYLVPQSINLSRMDFESCDVIEEIRRRVDDAGIDRSLITVEITESVIGGDFDFMKEQVRKFRELGFPVWMDDFGSGYSSLDVLQQIHFDLIKFDMRFMERFDEGDESKIILTELMKMAIGLGMETVCEGVEYPEQVEFLKEIGCTRIQGYYYGKPIPFERILAGIRDGSILEYENPDETEYYSSIGRINLYDMSAVASEDDESLSQYFNTLPMSIMEVSGTKVKYIRCNRSYREFMSRTVGVPYSTDEIDITSMDSVIGLAFLKSVVQCGIDGNRTILDDRVNENTITHTLIRRVAVNPVTKTAAVAAAVLAVIREDEQTGTNYSQMARALSGDYVDLYYVDLDSEKFIQYTPDAELEDLVMERHGENFFAASKRDAQVHLVKEDQAAFLKAFTKENVTETLEREGQFNLTYRLIDGDENVYVSMKAVRMPGDRSHILVAVSDVNDQMRQKEEMSRLEAERAAYSRVSALTQDFICIYTIDPDTDRYVEYRATSDYAGLGVPREGDDFWAQTLLESAKHIYPEDLEKFRALVTRENIMRKAEEDGIFTFRYRLVLSGKPHYVSIRAALVDEEGSRVLVMGIYDIDTQIRNEQEYERKLSSARSRANLDLLTGVKNRTAYENMSESLTRQIESGENVRYAIVICRVHGVGWINETLGREAGNMLIRRSCDTICETFKHSPVFRVAGDKFAVIAMGHDYECIEDLMEQIKAYNPGSEGNGEPGITCGMAKYDGTGSVASVFHRAEVLCSPDEN